MKNITLRLILFLFSLFPVACCWANGDRHSFGMHVGPNYSFLRGNEVVDHTQALLFVTGGVHYQYDFNRHLALKSNLAYERKGLSNVVFYDDSRFYLIDSRYLIHGVDHLHVKSYANYLTMPLLLRYSFHRETIFYVNVGCYVGRLLKGYTSVDELSYKRDDTYVYKPWDVGLVGGVGGEYPINDYLYWTFDVQYSRGLVNIITESVVGDGKIQTNAFSVLLGLSVQIQRKETQ